MKVMNAGSWLIPGCRLVLCALSFAFILMGCEPPDFSFGPGRNGQSGGGAGVIEVLDEGFGDGGRPQPIEDASGRDGDRSSAGDAGCQQDC
jgi:hypothetical protein